MTQGNDEAVPLEETSPEENGTGQARPKRKKKESSGVALCLSGGGYRATLFHLGAMRRMHELGILEQITHVSSVSGGSLMAAIWAGAGKIRDFETQIAQPVRALCGVNIRTTAFLKQFSLIPNNGLHHIADCLEPLLRNNKTLADLPDSPIFVFCATDLGYGVNWEFSRHSIGSYKAGYSRGKKNNPNDPAPEAKNWRIALVAAISACFPPVFNPYQIQNKGAYKGGDGAPKEQIAVWQNLLLNDGGNYDNLGLEPVKQCATVLVSDAGTPYRAAQGGWLGQRLMRYFTTLDKQARGLRREMLHAEYGRIKEGTDWNISHALQNNIGYSKAFAEEVLSFTRTDLDVFNQLEQGILENHGYCAFEAQRLRPNRRNPTTTRLGHLNPSNAAFELPHPEAQYQESHIGEAARKRLMGFSFLGNNS